MTRIAALVIAALLTVPAAAQPPAEFYKGKTIQLLVGFGPGGEDDVWARTIAKHIGNHIPGQPAMVPVHAPGSGGLLVVNRLYNAAAKDGSVIGMINRGIPFEPLLGGQGTQFDARKINYLGSPGRDTTVCAARKDAAVKTVADLYSHELTLGGTGSGADTAIYPEFLAALLGMKMKVVKGYKGSHEIHLAMERNEVQGICLAYDSLLRGTLARQGQINILLQAATEADPRIKDVPLGLSQARSAEDSAALALFFARAAMGRPLVAPAEVPPERIAALRTGFQAMLRDPVFLEDAKKQNLNVVPITGEAQAALIARSYATPPAIVARTIKALGRGG